MATYEDLATDIDRIARKVAKDYPDIDWEDVRQELVVFVLTNGPSIKLREDGGNPSKFLELVAQTYCGKQRAQHLSLSPQYAYRPSDVKLILETAFQADDIPNAYVPDDARHPLSNTFNIFDTEGAFTVRDRDPFHEPDAMEVASDVKAALLRLKIDDKEAIFSRYVLNIIPDNASWERKKLNRAINRLTHTLNTYRGKGPNDVRSRRAISNAGARARISEGYDY